MPRGDSLHFRMGKGMLRERRKAQSAKSLVATMDFLGMTDEQKRAFLEKVKSISLDQTEHRCRGCGCPVSEGYERCGKAECSPFYV